MAQLPEQQSSDPPPTESHPMQHKVKRIGILLAHMDKLNITALKFLVLRMNMLQHTFEYEFLPLPLDKFPLSWSNQAHVNRCKVEHPRDAQRDVLSNEVALDRLSCCCVFCEGIVFPPHRQQTSAVTKMPSEAALHYTANLLQSRCASRGNMRRLRSLQIIRSIFVDR